eukprot:scaffold303_cov285-Chaetoceros_neogracile.AAC.13
MRSHSTLILLAALRVHSAFAFSPIGQGRFALLKSTSSRRIAKNERSCNDNGNSNGNGNSDESHSSQVMIRTALNSAAISLPHIPLDAIKQLDQDGYVVLENWLPKIVVQELRKDVQDLRSKGKFNTAKIGQDSTNTLNTDIRIAETCFLGKSKLQDVPSESRSQLYSVLENLRAALSANDILDRLDSNGDLVKAAPALDASLSELSYAYYPTGGFYRRHTDAVVGSASVLRSYSLLMYLNNEWKESDGGRLRVHLDSGKDFLPEGEEPNYVDVEPKGGTLILFRSEQIPHEVLDTKAERMAIVGWYNRPFTSADMDSLASEGDKMRSFMLLVAAALVTFGLGSIFASG